MNVRNETALNLKGCRGPSPTRSGSNNDLGSNLLTLSSHLLKGHGNETDSIDNFEDSDLNGFNINVRE